MATRALAISVNRKNEGIQKIAHLLKDSSKGCTQVSAREAEKGSIFFLVSQCPCRVFETLSLLEQRSENYGP